MALDASKWEVQVGKAVRYFGALVAAVKGDIRSLYILLAPTDLFVRKDPGDITRK